MRKTLTFWMLAAVTIVLIPGSVTAQVHQPVAGGYTGPKKRIAVSRFDAIGTFAAQYSGWDVCAALTAQLTTELARTGRFIVVERADLTGALREQELGLMGVTTAETAARAGQVLGAQLLIRGSVTEFEQAASGKGIQLGIDLGGATVGLGGSRAKGTVALDLRIIDAMTGEVVESHRAEAQVGQRTLTAEVTAGPLTLGNSKFARTPLGQATREAITRAVDIIVSRMDVMPWTGRIVDIGDQEVYVNAGRDANFAAGQRLVVSTVARQLIDPSTGAALGAVERSLGELEIVSVQDKFSVARMLGRMRVTRGDVVRVSANLPSTASVLPTTAVPVRPVSSVRSARVRATSSRSAASKTRPSPTADTIRQAIQALDSASNTAMAGGMPLPFAQMPVPANTSGPLSLPMSTPGSDPTGASGAPLPGSGTSPVTQGARSSPATLPASAGASR